MKGKQAAPPKKNNFIGKKSESNKVLENFTIKNSKSPLNNLKLFSGKNIKEMSMNKYPIREKENIKIYNHMLLNKYDTIMFNKEKKEEQSCEKIKQIISSDSKEKKGSIDKSLKPQKKEKKPVHKPIDMNKVSKARPPSVNAHRILEKMERRHENKHGKRNNFINFRFKMNFKNQEDNKARNNDEYWKKRSFNSVQGRQQNENKDKTNKPKLTRDNSAQLPCIEKSSLSFFFNNDYQIDFDFVSKQNRQKKNRPQTAILTKPRVKEQRDKKRLIRPSTALVNNKSTINNLIPSFQNDNNRLVLRQQFNNFYN